MGRLLERGRVLRLLTLFLLAGAALGAAARRFDRVVVSGDSMRPSLVPGDRLVVWRGRRPRPGDVVVAADPRQPGRVLVKRVAAVGRAGVTLVGDNPAASTDGRALGPVTTVTGRAVYRYHPRGRAGVVR